MQNVNCSAAFRWFVLLLLPFTLVWKLLDRPANGSRELDAQSKVVQFLARQYFTISEQGPEGQKLIFATAGPCHMVVAADVSSNGWERDMLRHQAAANGPLFFVFRGKTYADQPTWLTVSNSLWSRFKRGLGLKVQDSPIVAVVATPNCDVEGLPWNELQ